MNDNRECMDYKLNSEYIFGYAHNMTNINYVHFITQCTNTKSIAHHNFVIKKSLQSPPTCKHSLSASLFSNLILCRFDRFRSDNLSIRITINMDLGRSLNHSTLFCMQFRARLFVVGVLLAGRHNLIRIRSARQKLFAREQTFEQTTCFGDGTFVVEFGMRSARIVDAIISTTDEFVGIDDAVVVVLIRTVSARRNGEVYGAGNVVDSRLRCWMVVDVRRK